MRNIKRFTLILFSISALAPFFKLKAQIKSCGTDDIHRQLLINDLGYAQRMQSYENYVLGIQPTLQKTTGVIYKLPVVVHVMHKGEAVGTGINVSDQAIKDAIQDLNEMYRKVAGSVGDGNGVDVEIEYSLAVRDPSGNCTNGIVRVDMTGNSAYMSNGVNRSATGGISDASLKAISVWNQTKYYNIWLISEIDNNNGGSGVQGYAYFASSHGTSVDGAVILSSNFISGTSTTAAHELGHSLNLYHTFEGDGTGSTCPSATNGCGSGAGDCCGDIPAHIRSPYDCSTGINTCDGTTQRDLFIHNYMDYSDDQCQNMLTANQKTRMVAAVSTTRASFLSPENGGTNMSLVPPAVAVVDFKASATVLCGTGQTVNFIDMSSCTPNSYIPASSYSGITHSWVFTNGTNTYTSSAQNPSITFTNTGTYSVSLSVTNASGTTSLTKPGMIVISTAPSIPCTPTSQNVGNYGQTIYNVTLNSINYSSSSITNVAYTNLACAYNTTVNSGATYNLSISARAGGSGAEVFEVYINYNNDADFADTGELVFSGSTPSNTSGTFTTNITIPTTTTVVQNTLLRMRVIGETTGISATERTCGVGLFIGDVEDFGVFINPPACVSPTITSSTGANRCGTGTLTLSAISNTGTVNWYTAATGGTAIATGTVYTTPSLTATTIYYVDATNAGCTTPTRTTVTATINAIPVVTLSPSSSTICSTKSATLTASGASTYTWAPSGSGTSSVVSPTATTIYTLTGTSAAGCVSVSKTSTVTVNTTPTITLSPVSSTICSGLSTTLTASGASTYTWAPSGSGTNSVLSPTAITIYTVTGTSTAGCVSSSKTSTIIVNSKPTTSASTTGTLTCTTLTVVLNSSLAGMNYLWTPPSGASVSSATIQNTSASGSGIYTLSVLNPTTGCSYSTTTSVTQNTLSPIVSSSATGTLTCTNLTTKAIVSTSTSSVSYVWTGTGTVSGTSTATVTVNQPGSYNYTVTNTTNGCKTTGSQNIAQDISTPTVSTSGSQTITCATPNVTLTGTAIPSNSTPLWSGGVTSGANSYSATTSTANVYTLTVTNPANGCVSSSTTQVSPGTGVPVVNTSVTNTLSCSSLTAQTIATTTSSPVSYSWAGPGIVSGATTASATVNAGGQYTVIVTNTISGCSSTSTVVVNQNTVAPVVTGATSGTLTCSVFSVNAIATTTTTPVSYSWTGTGIVSGATTGTVIINQPGTYNYTVTNTSNGCKTSGTRSVTQNTTSPVVTAFASGSLTCSSLSVNAVASTTSSPATYTWTGPGIVSGASTGTVAVNKAGTYNYTVTSANGCNVTGSLSVSQNTTAPTLTLSPLSPTICFGTSQTLSVTTSGSNSILWSTGAGTSSISVTPTITSSYNATVTNTVNGCSASKTTSVIVNAIPSLTLNSTSASICAGQTVTLTASGASTYSWSPGAQTTTVITANPTGNSSYTVRGFNGSCSSTKTITINVAATPSVITSITNTTICSGLSVVATATGATTYTWLPSGSGTSSTLTPSSTMIYTVTGSNGSCLSTPTNFTINVTTTPTVGLTSSASSICSGQTVTLTASGASTYSWSPGAQTTTVITANPTGNSSYTVRGFNGSCSSTKTININVTNTPTVAASITNTSVCDGTSVIVSASGASTYTWIPNGSGNNSTLTPSSMTVYTVTGANGSCLSTPTTFTINVIQSPTIGATASSTLICNGQTSTLTGSGATNYTWSPSANLSSSTGSVVISSAVNTTTYTVTGNDGTCSSNNTIVLTVSSCTGLNNLLSTNDITLFPNPSKGMFTITNTSSTDKFEVIITNTLGQMVIQESAENVNQMSLDLSKHSKGIYYAKVTTVEGTKLFKLMLE
ncbi:MAG: M43 family zinc metalloprotease [Bacteroidota bacterium]